MSRLLTVALVLFAVACSSKGDKPGGAGSAAASGSAVASGSVAGTASGSAAPTPAAVDAAAPTGGSAGSAPAATGVSDDGLADHGAGHDGRGLYYGRALTAADLEGRTLRDLALMRNTIYARAGHSFRKAWLREHFTALAWYAPLAKDDEAKLTAVDRANAKLIAAHESAYPRDAMVASQAALAARGDRTPIDDVELRLLGEQLGKTAAPTGEPAAAHASPLEDPAQLDRLLTVDELTDLSRRDLRILRNTVYARHGRVFKSALLQDWFDNKDWYHPDPAFDEAQLSSIDKKNVRLIRSVEDSLGGPLTDQAQQADDGWWDAA